MNATYQLTYPRPEGPMHVGIEGTVTETSLRQVRHNFNPSGDSRVELLKSLAALFITECNDMRLSGIGSREAAIACTEMEQACMWAVKAATSDL